MNISARTVVEKMEEEMMELTERLEHEDENAVKNHARVLKAYCDIILGDEEKEEGAKSGGSTASARSAPSAEHLLKSSTPQSSSVPREEMPSTEGNLLEF